MAKKKNEDECSISLDIIKQLEKLDCKVTNNVDEFVSPYFLSTGIFSLDRILSEQEGIGASCIECFGGQGSGKTSLTLNIMAQAQKIGLNCHYVNMERAINKSIVSCFKELNPNKVSWINPQHGQAALDAIETILRSVPRSVVVLDSVPACISAAQLESSAEDNHMAVIARLFSNFLPKACNFTRENESILILLNQVRDNLSGYGAKELTPGGHAIKFYCDWRIQLKVDKKIQGSGDDIIGQKVKATIVKNRAGVPYQTALFTLIYGKGFDTGFDLLEFALSLGIIKQAGSWLEFPDGTKVQGQIEATNRIKDNKDLQENIKTQVRELFK